MMRKRALIAITGLPNAGKTSFTHRLLTGRYTESIPTLGVDVEFIEYLGYPIQVFDLGGHEAFRNKIWRRYVQQSNALIFIFDASNMNTLEESAKWFWQCVEWIKNKSAPILFLANKKDLIENVDETIQQIVTAFNLQKLANDPERSFMFFFVSVKTAENIAEAMNWLILKQFARQNDEIPDITTIDFFVEGPGISLHIYYQTSERNNFISLIQLYKNRWHEIAPSSMVVTEETEHEDSNVFFIREGVAAALIIAPKADLNRSIFLEIVSKINEFHNRFHNEEHVPAENTDLPMALLEMIKRELLDKKLGLIAQHLVIEITLKK